MPDVQQSAEAVEYFQEKEEKGRLLTQAEKEAEKKAREEAEAKKAAANNTTSN